MLCQNLSQNEVLSFINIFNHTRVFKVIFQLILTGSTADSECLLQTQMQIGEGKIAVIPDSFLFKKKKKLIKAVGQILQCQMCCFFPWDNNVLRAATSVQFWQLPGKGRKTTRWQDFHLLSLRRSEAYKHIADESGSAAVESSALRCYAAQCMTNTLNILWLLTF